MRENYIKVFHMIGLVIVTHGNLGKEFIKVTEHVVGQQDQIESIGILANDNVLNRRDELLSAIKNVDKGDGVIVLTDMFGGTPSNLAISVTDNKNIEVLAGVNLPTLIKLVSIRDKFDLTKVAHQAKEAGQKYINVASQLLAS